VIWTVAFIFLFLMAFFICIRISNKAGKRRYAEFCKNKWTRGYLRTPDDRFSNLPGYPFQPNYMEIHGLRIHYLDEGPSGADPVLLIHGEPTWSYLYRKMIPPIAGAGHRVIVPDLIGFGRSDKLVSRQDYSYQMHVDVVTTFIEALNLNNITLFCQDWGGLIGLRVAAENPDRFARIIAANTALPGKPPLIDGQKPQTLPSQSLLGALLWVLFSQLVPQLKPSALLQRATVSSLPPDVLAAYDAPFPDKRFLAGARMFPVLILSQIKENTLAWQKLNRFEKPFLTAFSDKDPILGGGDLIFQQMVPGAKRQPHTTVKGAGHFLQEDKSEELASLILAFTGEATLST